MGPQEDQDPASNQTQGTAPWAMYAPWDGAWRTYSVRYPPPVAKAVQRDEVRRGRSSTVLRAEERELWENRKEREVRTLLLLLLW